METECDNDAETTPAAAAGQPIHLRQRFKDVTYWEWDKVPSSMDSTAKLQDWLKLASVVRFIIIVICGNIRRMC